MFIQIFCPDDGDDRPEYFFMGNPHVGCNIVHDGRSHIKTTFFVRNFDAACLAFHTARRNVRTASAAQVRQPLQQGTGRTSAYGALLDPLRRALGLPAHAAV